MPGLSLAKPADIGFDPVRLQRAFDLLKKWADDDKIPAAGLCVGRKGEDGRAALSSAGSAPQGRRRRIRKDALFLVASITKPVTVDGRHDARRARRAGAGGPRRTLRARRSPAHGKDEVQIRHLMTHTSGLPDMLPGQRASCARPTSRCRAFVEAICQAAAALPAGHAGQLPEHGHRHARRDRPQVSGKTLREFLRKEIFEPLGMADTSLGWQPAKKERIAAVRVPAGTEKERTGTGTRPTGSASAHRGAA